MKYIKYTGLLFFIAQGAYMSAFGYEQYNTISQTIDAYESFIIQHPSHAATHLNLAQLYLTLGMFTKGWQELEWHLGYKPDFTRNAHDYFQSHESLNGKIVLLSAEWGAGDTLWLIRYARLLKKRGAYVIMHVLHDTLIPLLEQQDYLDEILPKSASHIPCHFEIPIMSLPMVFDTTVETVPHDGAYIQIDQTLVKKWGQLLSADTCFKIGICWHGNTIHDESKFMPLKYFAQLADIPGVSIYSLQQHHGLDQLDTLVDKSIIKTFDCSFDSIPFCDTAAVMKNLDVVITVDTSIAHLAGTLNVPVWTVLPYEADWRWMLNRTDSPWYPTMTLYRKLTHDWQDVIDEIKKSVVLLKNQ